MVNSCESAFCQFSFAVENLEFNVFTITKDFPIFNCLSKNISNFDLAVYYPNISYFGNTHLISELFYPFK